MKKDTLTQMTFSYAWITDKNNFDSADWGDFVTKNDFIKSVIKENEHKMNAEDFYKLIKVVIKSAELYVKHTYLQSSRLITKYISKVAVDDSGNPLITHDNNQSTFFSRKCSDLDSLSHANYHILLQSSPQKQYSDTKELMCFNVTIVNGMIDSISEPYSISRHLNSSESMLYVFTSSKGGFEPNEPFLSPNLLLTVADSMDNYSDLSNGWILQNHLNKSIVYNYMCIGNRHKNTWGSVMQITNRPF